MPETLPPHVVLSDELAVINWAELKRAVAEDNFDNGRTPAELRDSFAATNVRVFALLDGRVIGTARALADGVCNAFVVDVWTKSAFRRQGLAKRMMTFLEQRLEGHHVALFTEHAVSFYDKLGYSEERVGMSKVVGTWLRRTRDSNEQTAPSDGTASDA
ncbi:GNAT family N-acetyltransferase [Pelomonas sp. SE-A7]|uniref:GNAT family N-acetyltransferase n=1 Tax=Pelomonas sp. SE-A7 TaxID=3054953 RepID=UPI00259CB160|nr:GNAT family N-acetyltransferase [Pelomonas sp. SE-A7]MDM4767177.1 GNAT family N-acetyltransferase [Pelomonas sp. SE-A7]